LISHHGDKQFISSYMQHRLGGPSHLASLGCLDGLTYLALGLNRWLRSKPITTLPNGLLWKKTSSFFSQK